MDREEPPIGPDFFIVGAPKAGTTFLAEHLAAHPRIFVCTPKEPNYFARHLTLPHVLARTVNHHNSREAYLDLFRRASARHLAVGDASTRYLRSTRALREIREFRPDARIVVMLRDPVELARAWHAEKLLDGQEDEADFRKAWQLQAERKAGHRQPARLGVADALFYADVAGIGSQLEAVLRTFPEQQVCNQFFDDLRDPRRVYESVLSFLDVPSDGRTSFRRINPASRFRHRRLGSLLVNPPPRLQDRIDRVKHRLGVRHLGVGAILRSIALRREPREPLPADFRRELVDAFRGEIEKLEALTGRDLTAWRRPEAPPGDRPPNQARPSGDG